MRVGTLPAIQGPRDSPPVPGRRGAAPIFGELARYAGGPGGDGRREIGQTARQVRLSTFELSGATHALGAGPMPGEGRGSCGRGSSVAAHRIPGRWAAVVPGRNGPRGSPGATTPGRRPGGHRSTEADVEADVGKGPLPRGRSPAPAAAAEYPDKGNGRTSSSPTSPPTGARPRRRRGVPAVEPAPSFVTWDGYKEEVFDPKAGPITGSDPPFSARIAASPLTGPSSIPLLPLALFGFPASLLRGFPASRLSPGRCGSGPVRAVPRPVPPPGQDRSLGSAADAIALRKIRPPRPTAALRRIGPPMDRSGPNRRAPARNSAAPRR